MRQVVFSIFLTFLIFVFADLSAANTNLVKPLSKIKISKKFNVLLDTAASDNKFKIWIFFTDKGFSDNKSLKAKLKSIENNFTERSVKRRINRTGKTDIFDFYDIPVYREYVRALKSMGLVIQRESRWLNAVSVYANYETINRISDLPFVSKIKPVVKAFRKTPMVDGEENSLPKSFKSSADIPVTWYGDSYIQLNRINVPRMHSLGYNGAGVLIAIFDTGFDLYHPVFGNLNLIADSSFIDDTLVNQGHGTSTLSIVGGRADSTMIGSAYGADFITAATEVVSYENQTEEDNWVAAAEWADYMGADIITSSLGYTDWYVYSDLDGNTAITTIAADIAASRGIAVFNSAGNERLKPFPHITPPADGDSVIAVGAVTSLGNLASFSSPGPTFDGRIKPDIMAMGEDVYRANPGTGYTYGNGTSFSCPLAAGAAAILLQIHPDWTPMDLREAMIKSADRYSNPDNDFGYGIFDTFRAAALFEFYPIEPILLTIGDSLNLDISVFGQDTNSVVITAYYLPDSVEYSDSGNGVANLKYKARSEDIGTRTLHFSAMAGLMQASIEVLFTVFANEEITAGPNPFSDSLTVFLGPDPGTLKNISIFSINGEKVN